MKIEYRKGDLLRADEPVIVHGCNAKGVMGSGVAKLLRDRWPEVFDAYYRVHVSDRLRLGQTIWVDVGVKLVVNAITQAEYGRDPNRVYASYDAIRSAMAKIDATAAMTQQDESATLAMGLVVEAVAMPLIGAGLANGSWKAISKIIEEESKHFRPVVYLIDGVIPNT